MSQAVRRISLFVGSVQALPDESRRSAMVKRPAAGRRLIRSDGLVGDEQADRRVHGGPDKALHFYAPEHYAVLAAEFPQAADLLVPGSIGENVSAPGLDEASVCLGDVYAIGSARVQVSQPRQPCWKIDARYRVTGMTARIAETGMTGGYWRVLEEGEAESGDALELVERIEGAPTLATLWQLLREHRPDPGQLLRLSSAPGLSEDWRRKIADRAAWLREHGGGR